LTSGIQLEPCPMDQQSYSLRYLLQLLREIAVRMERDLRNLQGKDMKDIVPTGRNVCPFIHKSIRNAYPIRTYPIIGGTKQVHVSRSGQTLNRLCYGRSLTCLYVRIDRP